MPLSFQTSLNWNSNGKKHPRFVEIGLPQIWFSNSILFCKELRFCVMQNLWKNTFLSKHRSLKEKIIDLQTKTQWRLRAPVWSFNSILFYKVLRFWCWYETEKKNHFPHIRFVLPPMTRKKPEEREGSESSKCWEESMICILSWTTKMHYIITKDGKKKRNCDKRRAEWHCFKTSHPQLDYFARQFVSTSCVHAQGSHKLLLVHLLTGQKIKEDKKRRSLKKPNEELVKVVKKKGLREKKCKIGIRREGRAERKKRKEGILERFHITSRPLLTARLFTVQNYFLHNSFIFYYLWLSKKSSKNWRTHWWWWA